MRMIIIAVAALLVLGGGGAGAYYYFSQQAEASAGEEAGEGHDEVKAAEDGDKHGEKGGGGHGEEGGASEFVELEPLILPIVDNNGVSQTVSMVIALEVAGPAEAEQVKAMAPKLTDAYIEDMYGMLSEHAALKGGVIQVGQIKKRLSKLTDDVMGEDVVTSVLLQVVQQRPI